MSTTSTIPARTVHGIRLFFAVWLAATAIGTIIPESRVWGLHLPAFLPLWGQVVFWGTAALFLVLPTRLFDKLWGAVPKWITGLWQTPFPAFILVAAFIVFRVGAALLGDGMLRGGEPELGKYNPTEILPGYLAFLLYGILHPLFDLRGSEVVAIISIIAGCGFLFLVWSYPRRIWKNPKDQLIARMVLICGGGTALFFGYIESYAIPYTAILGYLLAAEAHRRGPGGFCAVVVFFILAVAAHLAAIVLYPSLVILGLNYGKSRRWPLLLIGTIGLAAAIWGYQVLPSNLFVRGVSTGSVLLPFFPQPPLNYGLFSIPHIVDLANLLWLVVPGVLIGAPLFFVGTKMLSRTGARLFWPLAVIIPLSIPLLLDPKLGMARDWDLMTLGLVPLLAFWGIFLTDARSLLPRGIIRLPIFASFAVLAMFVGINTNTPAAISRFEKLVELDKERGGYGYEALAYLYRSRGETDMVISYWQKALQLEDNRRYWAQLSMAYRLKGDEDNALDAARHSYFSDTSRAAGAYFLANTFNRCQQPESAFFYLNRTVLFAPENHKMQHDLAVALYRRERMAEAQEHIEAALQLAPDSAKYYNVLATILIQTGKFAEAIPILNRALALEPSYVDGRINLAMAYYLNGQNQLARAELAHLSRQSDLTHEEKDEIVELTRRIRRAHPTEDTGD